MDKWSQGGRSHEVTWTLTEVEDTKHPGNFIYWTIKVSEIIEETFILHTANGQSNKGQSLQNHWFCASFK